jgi:4-amino-4-deoxy-L-arabinose transferase-like glycosyltransferase
VRKDTAGPITLVSLPQAASWRIAGARQALGDHARWLAVLMAASFLLRLLWVLISDWQPTPDDDAYRYDFFARELLAGNGYVHLNGEPTAFWPPGYPLLLAAVYGMTNQSVFAAQLFNVVIATATVPLVYALGRRTVGAQAGLVGAGIVAFFPSLIFFSAVTLSETVFIFLALLGVYLLVVEAQREGHRDMRLLLAAGLVLGFAALVRGQALLLPLVAIPFWLRSGIGWPRIADKLVALALGIGLIAVPWTVRNAIELDSPVLISTNAGVDFWMGHNAEAGGTLTVEAADELVFRHPELTTAEREVRVNREGFREGIEYAVSHPVNEVFLVAKKFFWLYHNDEEGLKWNEGHGGQQFLSDTGRAVLYTVSNAYYFGVLALFALGLWLMARPIRAGPLLLLSLIVYWTVVHLVFFGDPRFHAPIMPVVALLAAPALIGLWSGRLARRRPARTASVPD